MTKNMSRPRSCKWLILGGVAAVLLMTVERLVGLVPLLLTPALAADLPKTIDSAPCTKAPTIDGVLGEGEWKEATTFNFDMPMVQLKPFAVKDKRACELRVMNSANNLYISLRVPNSTNNKSIEPLEIDVANLAFCQGKDVAKGDDRKVIFAGGFYADKHIVGPGKDEDDAQQDGQGAVAYDKGYYTFEWAVPLGSKDADDLRAKPGDEFRFNIAFFDRFTADLKNTQGGGLFGPDLEKAVNWGTLKLAADVKDDGGPSLTGPAPDPNFEFNVVYAAPKGNELKLDFAKPEGDGPFPLVVCIHGGAWQAGSRADLRDFQKAFTNAGFASASVQYRFPPKDRFPAQLDDITTAVRFLVDNRQRFRIDPERVGVIGNSAGAHLALLAAFTEIKGCTVKAVVNMAGPTDLRVFASAPTGDAALKSALKRNSAELLEDLLGTADRKAAIYAHASPVTLVRKNSPAVLTIHGTEDDMVPFTQAEALHAALKKVGALERLIAVKGQGHHFGQWPDQEKLAVFTETIDHLKAHLKPTAPQGRNDVKPPATRPFRMGFTRWPADLSLEGFMTAQDFAHEHGDMVTVCFIGGIPWPESLADKPFSKDVQDNLSYRPPNGKKLFLQISILDKERKGMAPYWGEKDNLPLPKPWDTYALDSPEVRKAYLNFVLRAVDAMNPDFLAIGMENNILLSHDPAKWKQLKALHVATYKAVKEKHPKLPVFFTTEVMHYRKYASEARDRDQAGEVADLMKHSDLFAMSVYPHMSFAVPRPIPADFFAFARTFGKPVAVSEAGDSSRDVELKAYKLTLKGSEAGQKQFTELLLDTAAKDAYEFVSWTHTTDFEKLCAKLPAPVDDLARVWAYTGMQTGEKKPKPALAVWDAYLKAKYERPTGAQDASKQKRDARLSCAVALVKEGDQIKPFLEKPGPSFVQAYVRFDSDLPEDVIFGIDQEFIEGVAKPLYIKGGDWMALVGVQRTGAVWVAAGTDDTMKGNPSKDRAWEILDLGQKLKPDTWYRFRIEADFGTRHFRKFIVEGPGFAKTLDLSEYKLDYPNYMPFSDRAMSFYTFAMRGRSLVKPDATPDGKPLVYFDDVSGGPIAKDGKDIVAFTNGFEEQREIGKQPVSLPVIDLKKYKQGQWYLERDESLFATKKVKFARSGDFVGLADASID